MLQNSSIATHPLGQRRCPKCGQPMLLTRIEPTGEAGQEIWTFECSHDAYAETAVRRTG